MVGVANGWADDKKVLLLLPDELEQAYKRLAQYQMAPRGFGFWNIEDEGTGGLQLAKGLRSILKASALDQATCSSCWWT